MVGYFPKYIFYLQDLQLNWQRLFWMVKFKMDWHYSDLQVNKSEICLGSTALYIRRFQEYFIHVLCLLAVAPYNFLQLRFSKVCKYPFRGLPNVVTIKIFVIKNPNFNKFFFIVITFLGFRLIQRLLVLNQNWMLKCFLK